jgi:hypothetical protein
MVFIINALLPFLKGGREEFFPLCHLFNTTEVDFGN